MRGEIREGFGTDEDERENPADQEEVRQELTDFEDTWRSDDTDEIFDRVLAKITNRKNPEDILKEMSQLSKKLPDAMGDPEMEKAILTNYLKPEKSVGSEEDEDDDVFEEAS